MKEQYGITFEKVKIAGGSSIHYADNLHWKDGDLSDHLYCSDKYATVAQIAALDRALNGEHIQEHWGNVMGSGLYIYPADGEVEIGNNLRRISIIDFKELLEEWLAFLNT